MRVTDLVYMNDILTDVTGKLDEYALDGSRQITQDGLKITYDELYDLIDSLRALSSAFMSIKL